MYEAYITKLKEVKKHPNADRLQLGKCFDSQIVIDLSYKEGDIGIYFPTDGKLSKEFAEENNLVRKKDELGNEIGGYLDPIKRKISTIKLRGEKSDGLFLPIKSLEKFTDINKLKVGDRITILNKTLICEKYIPYKKVSAITNKIKGKKSKNNTNPYFLEHKDTSQLDYNIGDLNVGDVCNITLKMHGTSQRTGKLPKKLNFIEKLLNIKPKYEVITGTRRVVLDKIDGGYYGSNEFRLKYHNYLKNLLNDGETIYYEVVGYTEFDKPIMANGDNKKTKDKEFISKYGDTTIFNYGCKNGESDIYVYRMTYTDLKGRVIEYSYNEIENRCEQMGIKIVPLFERFIYKNEKDLYKKIEKYLDITDIIGKTHISEGIILRIENKSDFKAYKKKGFYFKVLEGIIKEEALTPDIEEIQE